MAKAKSEIEELLTADAPKEVTDAQMGTLAKAVNRFLEKEKAVIDATEALKVLTAEWRKIGEMDIPELMDNLGWETITLKSGQKVAVKDAVQCAIPAAARPEAHAWLEKNGHGDLIKIAVTVKFARGERTKAEKIVRVMTKAGCAPSMAESVHAGTLKAWARVELENGRKLPGEFFKVHIAKETTVK